MRTRRTAVLVTTAVLLAGLTVSAEVYARAAHGPDEPPEEEYIASCRTEVEGSSVTAYCHNPFPRVDRVQLHVECDRWWDLDSDSVPAEVGPTAYAELTLRCWKEVGSAWISHQPVPD
ncbi:hypothetical protein NX801_16550 [Streptomyces sp. LP05-1]|uniref:Secreted protein n=1 Tax=Streptomyces pyxinae TaxID=2970734 RepID=A0ABT2CIJ6_9ACTN|nr:hypothetical protein [Streptomyces sp. LP05-1]MCS0637244.1 hypothetical protein [Streptomyces sp. LP05-1]